MSPGFTLPRSIKAPSGSPMSSRIPSSASFFSSQVKRSWPAGTGVWVVKTVCWRAFSRATFRVSPFAIPSRISSSTKKAQ